MYKKLRYPFYLFYLTSFALWLGAGVYHSSVTGITWYSNPSRYVSHIINHPIPGAAAPFPIFAALLITPIIINLILFLSKWNARNQFPLISLAGAVVLILCTVLYFAPVQQKILANPPVFSNDEIITVSRHWLLLNLARLVAMLTFFIIGLIGLSKVSRDPSQ